MRKVFHTIPTLTTPRLILRAIQMQDAPQFYQYACDPLVAEHVLWDAHPALAHTRNVIRHMQWQYKQDDAFSLAIVLKETQQLIGTIGFMSLETGNRVADVGYSLNRSYWNKGYMTEALSALLAYGFHDLSLNRIEAQHECTNPSSGIVMRKVGMRREGCLRQRYFNKGKFVDVEQYAILRHEFTERKART